MIQRICFNRIACVWCMALMADCECMYVWVRVCMYERVLEFLSCELRCLCVCTSVCVCVFFYFIFAKLWTKTHEQAYLPRLHTFRKCKCARHKTQKNGQLYSRKSLEMNWWKWLLLANIQYAHKIFANYIRTHTRRKRERERGGRERIKR